MSDPVMRWEWEGGAPGPENADGGWPRRRVEAARDCRRGEVEGQPSNARAHGCGVAKSNLSLVLASLVLIAGGLATAFVVAPPLLGWLIVLSLGIVATLAVPRLWPQLPAVASDGTQPRGKSLS